MKISTPWKVFVLCLPILVAAQDGRLIGAYGLPGYSATNRLIDASGRTLTPGIVSTGTTFISGGQYYFPGGTANHIALTPAKQLGSNNNCTIMIAFCATNLAGGASHVFYGESISTGLTPYIAMGMIGSNCEAQMVNPANTERIDLVPTNVVAGAWNMMAMDWTGQTVRLWLNGLFIGQSNHPAMPTVLTGLNTAALGAIIRKTVVAQYNRGLLERCFLFSPAISDAEKSSIYMDWRATRP